MTGNGSKHLQRLGATICLTCWGAAARKLCSPDIAAMPETAQTIRALFKSRKYLCDTHTAVAVRVCERMRGRTTRHLSLSHQLQVVKFCKPVAAALGHRLQQRLSSSFLHLERISGCTRPPPGLPRWAIKHRVLTEWHRRISCPRWTCFCKVLWHFIRLQTYIWRVRRRAE